MLHLPLQEGEGGSVTPAPAESGAEWVELAPLFVRALSIDGRRYLPVRENDNVEILQSHGEWSLARWMETTGWVPSVCVARQR